MLTATQINYLVNEPAPGRNRLQLARTLAGLTQVEMSAALGITQPHISSLERGDYSDLPLETARKIAEFFGCGIEDLFPARVDAA